MAHLYTICGHYRFGWREEKDEEDFNWVSDRTEMNTDTHTLHLGPLPFRVTCDILRARIATDCDQVPTLSTSQSVPGNGCSAR